MAKCDDDSDILPSRPPSASRFAPDDEQADVQNERMISASIEYYV